ncbi:hypothetical protein E2P81_ATG08397 [Venturia nashicola]|nr:hypothetical protein E2P81_ATG08397 [Venturia nashicola]
MNAGAGEASTLGYQYQFNTSAYVQRTSYIGLLMISLSSESILLSTITFGTKSSVVTNKFIMNHLEEALIENPWRAEGSEEEEEEGEDGMTDKEKFELRIIRQNGKTIKAFRMALNDFQANQQDLGDELIQDGMKEWAWYDANEENISNIKDDVETLDLVNDEIRESNQKVDLIVEKRAQIYRQEVELIGKVTIELKMSVVELEEEGIDSRSVEELVEMMRANYGSQSRYGKFLLARIAALEDLLQYGEDSVEKGRSHGTLSMHQNVAETMPDRRLGNLPVISTGVDSGRAVNDELPKYEDIDTGSAPPEYDG